MQTSSTASARMPQDQPAAFSPYSFLKPLLAVLTALVIVQFLLIRDNQLIPFPFHHDDYDFLSYKFSTINWLPSIRPLSTLSFEVLSSIGQNFYYFSLQALLVGYISLVLIFLTTFLELKNIGFLLLFVTSVSIVSFEHLSEAYKYTGLITNLLSDNFGILALICFVQAFKERPSLKSMTGGFVFFLMAILSKEDYILPVLALCFYYAFFCDSSSPKTRKMAKITLFTLVVLAASLFLYNKFIAASPFTSSAATGPYRASIHPKSVLKTLRAYLFSSRVTKIAVAAEIALFLGSVRFWRNSIWKKHITVHVIIVSLIAPYTCLPFHIFPFYCLNWLPFQFGLLLTLQPIITQLSRDRRQLALISLIFFSVIVVAVSRGEREDIIKWYNGNAENNRNMIGMLTTNSAFLQQHKTIGIVGVPFLCPWFGVGGAYLSTRLQLNNDWVVFIPKGGEYYERLLDFQGSMKRGHVETRVIDDLKSFDAPVLKFDEHGNGTISSSAELAKSGY
jgi:hypothetical protein